jgi:hypothetical protein
MTIPPTIISCTTGKNAAIASLEASSVTIQESSYFFKVSITPDFEKKSQPTTG